MNLSFNYIVYAMSKRKEKTFEKLMKYLKPKNKNKMVLIIANVLSGSNVKTLEVLSDGDVIKKVNEIEVSDLTDFRKAITQPKKIRDNYYIIYETEDSKKNVQNVKDILAEEQFLSKQHIYQPSLIYKSYQAFFNKMK